MTSPHDSTGPPLGGNRGVSGQLAHETLESEEIQHVLAARMR